MAEARRRVLCSWVDTVLREQLQRGERKRVTGSIAAPQRTNLKPVRSIYWQQSFDERMHGHEQIREAVGRGAIQAGWGDQGGEDRPLEWVRVVNVDALADFLGIDTQVDQLQSAKNGLAPWLDRYPRVGEILGTWASLRRVRALGPDSWGSWQDALKVLDALDATSGEDQVIRVLSGHLFSDTKRIEQLIPQLDVLSAEQLTSRPRNKWEVLKTLGLVKQPLPLMVAGAGVIKMEEGPDCIITRPYVGVSPRAVRSLSSPAKWVLTIENLTTFHLASVALKGRADGLVVFTGGMPSPAWVMGFRSLTADLDSAAVFYHWGDIDVGGFRIAARVKEVALPEGAALQPWLMDLTWGAQGEDVSKAIGDAMRSAAIRAGWVELKDLPDKTLEQERVPISLPV